MLDLSFEAYTISKQKPKILAAWTAPKMHQLQSHS